MSTVNVSEQQMKMIEAIQEQSRWKPSKREIADQAIEELYDREVGDEEVLEQFDEQEDGDKQDINNE